MVGQVFLPADGNAQFVYLKPHLVTARKWEHGLGVVRCVIKVEYLFGYRVQGDERLHVGLFAVDADVVSVTRENLYTDDEGSLWLKYRRKKNELRASVKLLPEALALIEKYHDDNRPTLFPMIYHPNLRRHMKSLAVLAGVSGRLCYHQRRHNKNCIFQAMR